MMLDFFIIYIAIPFMIAILPLTSIIVTNRDEIFSASKLRLRVSLSIVVCAMLLLFSVYKVWSHLYGPASEIDYGPGIVQAIAIFFIPLTQLVISVPLAIWASYRKNNGQDV